MNTTTPELELAPPKPDEPPMKTIAPFDSYAEQVAKLTEQAKTITVKSVDDTSAMKLARTTRLSIKQLRIDITNRHRELKADILEQGNVLDGGKRKMLAILEPLEERMLDQEQYVEREQAKREKMLRELREPEIAPYFPNHAALNLGTMPEQEYQAMLADFKTAAQARIDREAREAQEAADRAAAEQKRIADQEVENARLKAENDKAEAERKKLLAEQAKQQAASALKLKKEKEAREKVEKELADAKKAEDDRKAQEAADEQKRQQEAAKAAKRAAAAPDRWKLHELAVAILKLEIPEIQDTELRNHLIDQRGRFSAYVEKKGAEL